MILTLAVSPRSGSVKSNLEARIFRPAPLHYAKGRRANWRLLVIDAKIASNSKTVKPRNPANGSNQMKCLIVVPISPVFAPTSRRIAMRGPSRQSRDGLPARHNWATCHRSKRLRYPCSHSTCTRLGGSAQPQYPSAARQDS